MHIIMICEKEEEQDGFHTIPSVPYTYHGNFVDILVVGFLLKRAGSSLAKCFGCFRGDEVVFYWNSLFLRCLF